MAWHPLWWLGVRVLDMPLQVGSRGFKGVRFNTDSRKWQAFITDPLGKTLQLPGEWDREEDAARAYDTEAIKRFGPDTELNLQVCVQVRLWAL